MSPVNKLACHGYLFTFHWRLFAQPFLSRRLRQFLTSQRANVRVYPGLVRSKFYLKKRIQIKTKVFENIVAL